MFSRGEVFQNIYNKKKKITKKAVKMVDIIKQTTYNNKAFENIAP